MGPRKRCRKNDASAPTGSNILTIPSSSPFKFSSATFETATGETVIKTVRDFISRGVEMMYLGSVSLSDFFLIQPVLCSEGYDSLKKDNTAQQTDVVAYKKESFEIIEETSCFIKDAMIEEAKKSGIQYDISNAVDGGATCLILSMQDKNTGKVIVTAFANITTTPLTRPELRLVQVISTLKTGARMMPTADAALLCCIFGLSEPTFAFRRAIRSGQLTSADQDIYAQIQTVPLKYGGMMSLPMIGFNLYEHKIKDLLHLDLNINTAVIYTGELLSVRPVDDAGDFTDSMTVKIR